MRRARLVLISLVTLHGLAALALATPPTVVRTVPDNGEVGVDPALAEIRVEFDQPMHPGGRSIVGGGPAFPEIAGDGIRWADARTIVIPVKLRPDHEYQLSINSDTFKGFTNRQGEPAEWYPVWFRTRGAEDPPPEPELTPEQNRAAIAALRRAIDEDYSYRDRLAVDWTKQIDERQAQLEQARTANEFARATAHILRIAEDAHAVVQCGDVRIGTRTNSRPPNVAVPALRNALAEWREHPSGLVTGRLDDGIGYVLLTACTQQQADAFAAAMKDLADAPALVIDLRLNGGGDELAARQIAGWFVRGDGPVVYATNRLRERGEWRGPFDGTVAPREDGQRYDKPIAVLVGPKTGSSAESFALMLQHGGHATLLGDVTKGSSGRPMPHDLGNGVTVHLPSWEDRLPDGTPLEGRGITPDVEIRTTPRDFEQRDPILQAAVNRLRRGLAG